MLGEKEELRRKSDWTPTAIVLQDMREKSLKNTAIAKWRGREPKALEGRIIGKKVYVCVLFTSLSCSWDVLACSFSVLCNKLPLQSLLPLLLFWQFGNIYRVLLTRYVVVETASDLALLLFNHVYVEPGMPTLEMTLRTGSWSMMSVKPFPALLNEIARTRHWRTWCHGLFRPRERASPIPSLEADLSSGVRLQLRTRKALFCLGVSPPFKVVLNQCIVVCF